MYCSFMLSTSYTAYGVTALNTWLSASCSRSSCISLSPERKYSLMLGWLRLEYPSEQPVLNAAVGLGHNSIDKRYLLNAAKCKRCAS